MKIRLSLLGLLLATATVHAGVIFNEPFNYVSGPIIAVGTNGPAVTNWFRHSGTASPSDAIINNKRLEISTTGGALTRQDDVHRNFTSSTNTQTILYSSFTVNCTNLPPAVGNYFAHFYVNPATFHARVFAQAGGLTNTWRLGIAGGGVTADRILSVDLATNTDYQVVTRWDPTGANVATLWVNPLAAGDPNVVSTDPVAAPAASLAYSFRQASSFGSAFFTISNLVVATSFNEAATNVWRTNALAPVVLYQPTSRTNFVGDFLSLSAVAAGQGLASLNYQWQRDGTNISNLNGNSNVFAIASVGVSNTGNYRMIATTPFGVSATSTVAFVWITNAPVPPAISQQPSNTTVFFHAVVTLSVVAAGPPPLAYQWFLNGSPAAGPNLTGTNTDTLTITDVMSNNGTAGTYRCDVSNPFGTTPSSNAVVTAVAPPAVSIAFLRTLVDPVSYLATNSDLRWQTTGRITTFTNLTTGDTASYYLQDDTAGINIFVTHGHDFRPAQGDLVAFVGWLSSFNSSLELGADTNDPTTGFAILSNNLTLPAAQAIPFSITNNLAYCETNLEGSLVMLTNVLFGANAGVVISTTVNTAVGVTNTAGEHFTLLFPFLDLDTAGRTLPASAAAVVGPLSQNLGNGVTPRNQGYHVIVTRFSDIISNSPPVITQQPVNISATQEQTVTFSVSATGTAPLTYYWGVSCPPTDPRWPNCGCAPLAACRPNLPTLTLTNVVPDDGGAYYVIISNIYGIATSQVATLTVTNPIPTPPAVTQAGYSGSFFTFFFRSLVGYLYEIQYKNSLSDPAWITLTTLLATANLTTVQDPLATSDSRFYRVVNRGPLTGPLTAFEPPLSAPAQPGAPSCGSDQDNSFPYLFSGEFHHAEKDLVIKGRGLDFVWARNYRSKTGATTAVGNGWDFSYNLRVQPNGSDFDVYDGTGRQDSYHLQPNGIYAADQRFNEGTLSNTVFTLTFSDTGKWEFLALDGSLSQGKIQRITDRNSNSLSFAYDPLGRITNVVDTLGRSIRMSYNGDGFISAIADFAGRQVTYSYYQNGDAGGSFGDLKSVTSPIVTNTPNTNDFPVGKTTVYTYSKGFFDEHLNHNLLSITDPRGQTWLRNTYSAATNPAVLDFDRLVRQSRGYSNEVLTFAYFAPPPLAANHFAISKTIVNDRMGNVSEHLFDATNRLVRLRQFTGRAVPGVVTTETANRPIARLRPGDPDFFETSWEWNADSLVTRIAHANGDSVQNTYELALNPNASRRVRGNLRARTTLPGPIGADQPSITETFLYDTTFGGCCGFNFVTQQTDGRGYTTYHAYDSRGNRTNTIQAIPSSQERYEYNQFGQLTAHTFPDNGSGYRRRDVLAYYTNGPQAGYLQREIVDNQTRALTTTYEYDALGNVIRKIDPRGHDTLYKVNALDQVVREISVETINSSGIRYTNDFFFDANNNRVRIDVQNRDEQGVISADAPVLTTTYDYDILNQPIRSTQQAASNEYVTSELVYDSNHKPILARYGEAVAGTDPFNTTTTLHDERGLVFQEIQAQGSPDQSTTQYDYDPNGNPIRTAQGIEDEPRITLSMFDGYNRVTNSIDGMGNTLTFHYDANGNQISERSDGELDDAPGGTGNVRLSQTTNTYDPMNRRTRTDAAFFDTQNQTNIGSGLATTLTFYNDCSLVTAVVDANGNTNRTSYDTVNRVSLETDAKGNTVSYLYDANGNIISMTEVEKSDLGNPNRTLVTTYTYDNLDRVTQTRDSAGDTNRVAFDSRNNPVLSTDGKGNSVRLSYDGLARLTQKTVLMTDSGDGSGTVVSSVTTLQTWDASSRLRSQTDNNTNTTSYVYDPLNRRVQTLYADGSPELVAYDKHNNRVLSVDANSNVVSTAFDLLNRTATNVITLGPGVLGPTLERIKYDGQSRIVRAEDDQSLITRRYDSLSHVTRETQQILPAGPTNVVTANYDALGNVVRQVYPGGRAIVRSYDRLNRLSSLRDDPQGLNPVIATFNYRGPNLERRDYGNGTRYQPAFDGLRRMTNGPHSRIAGGSFIANRTYSWDASDNKTNSTDLIGVPTEVKSYRFDSANRLVHSENAMSGQFSDYTLDGVGNRLNVSGNVDPGTYYLSPGIPQPQDFQMNRYTFTPFGSRYYDRNGNLLGAGGAQYAYDHNNHLVQYTAFQSYIYLYDVLGRRLGKSTGGSTTYYVYFGVQEIEEQDNSGATLATFVWGNGVDDLLQMQRNGQTYFFHSDDQGSIRHITDASANVVEAYQYGDYGAPQFFDGFGSPLSETLIGNLTLFTGRRYDPELGWYFYRTRYLDPRVGRFVTADTVGIWQDPLARGNAFAYVGNNPGTRTDPMGTSWLKRLKKLLHKVVQIVPKPIIGVKGDLALCADFTTGNWDLSGRLWVGEGVKTAGLWTGFSYSANGRISHGNEPKMRWFSQRGTCVDSCDSKWLKLSPALSFVIGLVNQAAQVQYGPLSCYVRADFSASRCTASLNAHCDADLVEFIGGPAAAAVAQVAKRLGNDAEAVATGDIVLNACQSDHGPKMTSARACLGGYIRLGINIDDHP